MTQLQNSYVSTKRSVGFDWFIVSYFTVAKTCYNSATTFVHELPLCTKICTQENGGLDYTHLTIINRIVFSVWFTLSTIIAFNRSIPTHKHGFANIYFDRSILRLTPGNQWFTLEVCYTDGMLFISDTVHETR